ncbi:MAG: 3-mercaptopyruvate sulfurtransferase [Myxococcales bacterium]|nr:3-mercaptopyruvate sulfurtransferase [Myxococcales bacterium]
MTESNPGIVSVQYLADALRERPESIRVLDGSWHLPSSGRDAEREFAVAHIAGAQRFDIDAIADSNTELPHMLPTPEAFAAAASALGIDGGREVVVYDTLGLFSAARVWWMFRVFGHDRVRVLDGGLPAWRGAGLPLSADRVTVDARIFSASYRPQLVADLAQMRAWVDAGSIQVLDARPAARFHMRVPEPRPGVRPGRMPGARNLPITELLTAEGKLRDKSELGRVLEAANVDASARSVCSCGSGVTACIIALALYELGQDAAVVYDGSWTEWGGRDDTPIETA